MTPHGRDAHATKPRVENPCYEEQHGMVWARLTSVLNEWIASGHQIGAQVYISRAGETLADFAIGESRPGVPMTTDTVMLWLSAGKPFAAVALAQLRERGLLDFDDPVVKF